MSEETTDAGSSDTDTSASSEGSSVTFGSETETKPASTEGAAEGEGKAAEGDVAAAEGGKTPEGGEGGEDGGDVAAIDPNAVPEGDYQYQFPEGVELDKGMADKVNPIFKDIGLTQGQAQKVIDAYSQHIIDSQTAAKDARSENFENRLKTWNDELKADQDFGGDNFEKNSAAANDFFMKTIPEAMQDDMVTLFKSTGLGSHPAIVKYFHHLSKAFPVDEDSPISGRPSSKSKTREERMYPNG